MSKLYAAILVLLSVSLQVDVSGQSIINPADTIRNFTAGSSPTIPTYGTIAKWGRTPSLSWNTSEWKCYIYNGQPFRVHFPKSYNPTAVDGKIYPMLLFLHGDGEAGPASDNETELYHGGQPFQAQIDAGTYDGYVIAPQSTGMWGPSNYNAIIPVIDYMIANNKVDMARVTLNGLSAGGQGDWQIDDLYPQYFAGVLPMSAASLTYTASSWVNNAKFTPYWLFQGGEDGAPAPYTTNQVLPYYYNAGANFTYTLFPTQGHDTWDSAWLVPGFFPFLVACDAANPWTLFGRTAFCPGNTINLTLGLAPGFQAYQWRKNGVVMSATTQTINVTTAGVYDARVERNNIWSTYSPNPVNVVVQGASQTPPITLAHAQTVALPGTDGTNSVTLALPTGDSLYAWYKTGATTVLGTTNTLTVTAPGDYYASVIPKFGCSSIPSAPFEVINAAGPNAPTAATSLVANTLGFTKTQLTWASQPNPTNPPTAFEVYRGVKTGGPYTYLGQTTPSVLQWNDSVGLAAGAQYFYVIRSIDTTGAAPLSVEASTTTSSDVTPPTVPTNLNVVFTTNSTISLAWTAATDNVSVNHYAIYVNGQLSNVTPNTSFILNGLTQGQWYDIYVVAVDGSGNVSPHSAQVTAQAIVSGLSYNYYTSTTNLTVVANLNSLAPVATGISSNTNINLYTGTTTTNFGYIWTGYIKIPVTGTYKFATASDDGSALWFNSTTATGTPTVNNDGLHGTVTVSSAALNLTAGVYPITIAYIQQGGGYAMTTEWSCQQLYGNTTLVSIPNQYFVGQSTSPGTLPAKPTNVKATAAGYNKINLTWTDNSTNETGYEVYRSTSPAGPFTIVTTLPANSTSLSDIGLSPSTSYYYEVQAINNAGGSGYDSLSIGGVGYKLYSGAFGSPMPLFDTVAGGPVATGRLSNFTMLTAAGTYTVNFGLKFSGILNVITPGTYTFSTTSDDASKLYIGTYNTAGLVVNNDFQQGATTRSGTIALTAGQYPIFVAYDQGTGGYSLVTSWTVPGTSTSVPIPDSALANKNWTATTSASPAAPVTPTLTGNALSASKISLAWSDTSGSITGYSLNRSLGDSLHFQLLASPAAGATSYIDSALFGHQTYYYQLKATGVGGTSAFTAATGVTTQDNAPVVAAIPNQAVRYGTTTTINVSAKDADGDALVFSAVNLPAFATLTDNGNGTATLSFNPASTDANVYPGVGVSVSDGHGGVTTGTFTLTVNNNYPPIIGTVSSVSVNTGVLTKIPLSATSQSGDVMVFGVSGVPNNYTLIAGPNGFDTLALTPTLGATGNYTVTVTVTDNTGAVTTSTFPLTVNFVNPTKTVYLRINAGDAIGAPWNNITGQVTTGIVDNTAAATPWTFNFNTSWWGGAALGPNTGNNTGVYPDAVLKDFWFFGDYGAPNTVAPTLSGLDTTKLYNLTFYAGSVFNSVPNNGTTVYNIGTQTVSLAVQNNTTKTVTISNVKPDATGTITINMSKQDANTPIGYINAIVVTQLFDDGTVPLSPYNLGAAVTSGSSNVVLNWADSAYNETAYEVWRATNTAGPWTLLSPDPAAKATTFTDATTAGFTTYYYKVRALNAHGYSYYTNVATVATPDKVPTLNAVANISLNWGTSDTVAVTTSNNTGNTEVLTAAGLPSFATFIDNGNGTGQLIVKAPDSTTGTYTGSTITMTDIADSVRTSTFSITVKNPLISSVYIHFSDGVNNGGTPWNNVAIAPAAGYNQGGLLNDANVNSGLTLTYQNGFAGITAAGDQTGNNSGIFADPVMRSTLYESAQKTDSLQISGLNPALEYSFQVFSSTDWGVGGTTSFSLLGQTKTINPGFNTSNLLTFTNLKPRANGTVSLGVTKATAAQYAYLNDFIIQGFDSTKLSIIGPSGLHVTSTTRTAATLAWTDNSWNETGYEVWRTTDAQGGVYSKIATLAANTTTYTNTGLTSNTTYYYTVRAIKGTVPSTYSNPVATTTTSYAVYMEFNQPNLNVAGLPWNAMNQQPMTGTTWANLHDDQGNATSTGMLLTGLWAGTSNLGMQTGNNSGIVPDNVMKDCYVLFAGQSGGFVISGLNISNSYDVSFFNSLNFQSDAPTSFLVNGQKVILNASLNTSSMVTAYGIRPDQNGNITITVSPLIASTEYGILTAMILRAYTPDANTIPSPPVTNANAQNTQSISNMTNDVAGAGSLDHGDTVITAYPNPFKTNFTLQVPAVNNGDKAVVEMYTLGGNQVYANEFKNLVAGPNYLTITPDANYMPTGLYMVKVRVNEGTVTSKVIKIMKQ